MGVAKTVNSELDNTQRQIDAERKRQLSKKGAAGKLEKLVTKKGEVCRAIIIYIPYSGLLSWVQFS